MLKKIIKKNYKLVLGMIIGLTISTIVAYASTIYEGNIISYDNSNSSLSSTDVQGALDELYGICSINVSAHVLKLGDYISMTPTVSSYTTDTTYTGYTETQTINPQELNLWRVISLNDDGTVDIISEYTSSVSIRFSEKTGYKNFVGYLNVLASQYENSAYTIGSRYFGYNGQTEYITTLSSGSSVTEEKGGGDSLYSVDLNLVKEALGTLVATRSSGTSSSYWVASRSYSYNSSPSSSNGYIRLDYSFRWNNSSESIGTLPAYRTCSSSSSSGGCACGSTTCTYSQGSYLRPIVVLKAFLTYPGSGTKESPYLLSGN